MSDTQDFRAWSISARGLSRFVRYVLESGVPNSSARSLQKELKSSEIYPARDLKGLCQPIPPDIFVTYHSAQSFAEVESLVWNTCHFALAQISAHYSDSHNREILEHGIRFWIDFLFIDQTARDIGRELDVLPSLLDSAAVHIVLGSKPLTRAWCCYEIALFNQDCASVAADDPKEIRSFVAPTRHVYRGWDLVASTNVQDKEAIRDQITHRYRNGTAGFRRVMDQASASALLSLERKSAHYPPAAMGTLKEAAERWFTRDVSQLIKAATSSPL